MDASEQAAEDVGYLIVQVYAIHEVVIQETGGMEGLRARYSHRRPPIDRASGMSAKTGTRWHGRPNTRTSPTA